MIIEGDFFPANNLVSIWVAYIPTQEFHIIVPYAAVFHKVQNIASYVLLSMVGM
jgi:hypothetical protein